MFYKNVVLKDFAKQQENTCARVPFLINLHTSAFNFIKKRDSGISALLKILGNF